MSSLRKKLSGEKMERIVWCTDPVFEHRTYVVVTIDRIVITSIPRAVRFG